MLIRRFFGVALILFAGVLIADSIKYESFTFFTFVLLGICIFPAYKLLNYDTKNMIERRENNKNNSKNQFKTGD